jgi:hypothetical protein
MKKGRHRLITHLFREDIEALIQETGFPLQLQITQVSSSSLENQSQMSQQFPQNSTIYFLLSKSMYCFQNAEHHDQGS